MRSRMPLLEGLFDNPARARLFKFFLNNTGRAFSLKELTKYLKIDGRQLKRELARFLALGILKSRAGAPKIKAVKRRIGKKLKMIRKAGPEIVLYFTDTQFYFFPELKNLVMKSSPIPEHRLLEGIKRLGKIKFAAIAGIFLNSVKSRADLLIIGDGINQKKTDRFLEDLEAEAGREINFVVLETREFRYRYDMFDRFLRDFFEFPHKKLINKLKFHV